MEGILIMSNFERAINKVLEHEGGYVNNPNDKGGHTNFGITLGLIQDLHIDLNEDGVINWVDIKTMSIEDAKDIYKKQWWDKQGYGKINDQTIATKVFDFAINMGAPRAHKLLQEAVNIALGTNLVVDGNLGPTSIKTINSAITDLQKQKILDAYCNTAWGFYTRLAERNSKLKVFLRGWRNRAYDIDRVGEIS